MMILVVYTEDGKELLGAAVLDIFIEDLIKDLESSFHVGTLKVFITKEDEVSTLVKQVNKNE